MASLPALQGTQHFVDHAVFYEGLQAAGCLQGFPHARKACPRQSIAASYIPAAVGASRPAPRQSNLVSAPLSERVSADTAVSVGWHHKTNYKQTVRSHSDGWHTDCSSATVSMDKGSYAASGGWGGTGADGSGGALRPDRGPRPTTCWICTTWRKATMPPYRRPLRSVMRPLNRSPKRWRRCCRTSTPAPMTSGCAPGEELIGPQTEVGSTITGCQIALGAQNLVCYGDARGYGLSLSQTLWSFQSFSQLREASASAAQGGSDPTGSSAGTAAASRAGVLWNLKRAGQPDNQSSRARFLRHFAQSGARA